MVGEENPLTREWDTPEPATYRGQERTLGSPFVCGGRAQQREPTVPRHLRPLAPYRRDDRVHSLMLELRRDAYQHRDGSPDQAAIDRFATASVELIERWTPR